MGALGRYYRRVEENSGKENKKRHFINKMKTGPKPRATHSTDAVIYGNQGKRFFSQKQFSLPLSLLHGDKE
jgi:hypothetical protein